MKDNVLNICKRNIYAFIHYAAPTKPEPDAVCYQTGFSSMSWFAKCFTKQFGMRPKDFIRQNQDGKSSG